MPTEIHQGLIHTSVIARLPTPCRVLGLAKVEAMDGSSREAVVVFHFDIAGGGVRKSSFDSTTGEYLGEC